MKLLLFLVRKMYFPDSEEYQVWIEASPVSPSLTERIPLSDYPNLIDIALMDGLIDYRPATPFPESRIICHMESGRCKEIRCAVSTMIIGLMVFVIGLIFFATSRGIAAYSDQPTVEPIIKNATKITVQSTDVGQLQAQNSMKSNSREQPTWADIVKKKSTTSR